MRPAHTPEPSHGAPGWSPACPRCHLAASHRANLAWLTQLTWGGGRMLLSMTTSQSARPAGHRPCGARGSGDEGQAPTPSLWAPSCPGRGLSSGSLRVVTKSDLPWVLEIRGELSLSWLGGQSCPPSQTQAQEVCPHRPFLVLAGLEPAWSQSGEDRPLALVRVEPALQDGRRTLEDREAPGGGHWPAELGVFCSCLLATRWGDPHF